MGLSRQAYYKQVSCQRQRAASAQKVVDLVCEKRLRQPRLGTRKLHHLLKDELSNVGIKVGRDGMFDILREARLLVHPKRSYHKTTNSHHALPAGRAPHGPRPIARPWPRQSPSLWFPAWPRAYRQSHRLAWWRDRHGRPLHRWP